MESAKIEATNAKRWDIPQDHEWRFEVGKDNAITLNLIQGDVECFGKELAPGRPYTFADECSAALFTWHGCTIEVIGECHCYISDETPMNYYLNTHSILQSERERARTSLQAESTDNADKIQKNYKNDNSNSNNDNDIDNSPSRGPVVMVVGGVDAGKSSLCQLLTNYASRMDEKVTYVDLDVGQGSISVPGTIGAVPIERPRLLGEDYGLSSPLVYFYGHVEPMHNIPLYLTLCRALRDRVEERNQNNDLSRTAGVIINTCGWIDGYFVREGYSLLLDTISVFSPNYVMVVGHERLYNDLKIEAPRHSEWNGTQIVKLPKSGGVVTRSPAIRKHLRLKRVKNYFYGVVPPTNIPGSTQASSLSHTSITSAAANYPLYGKLSPQSRLLRLDRVKLFKTAAGSQAPLSALPIGATSLFDPMRPVELVLSSTSANNTTSGSSGVTKLNKKELLHSILAVSYASVSDEVLKENVAGFVYVTELNMDRNAITVLSPRSGPVPGHFLVVGDIKWID